MGQKKGRRPFYGRPPAAYFCSGSASVGIARCPTQIIISSGLNWHWAGNGGPLRELRGPTLL